MTLRPSNHKKKQLEWLTQKELAERWRVSQGTIINLRQQGKLPFFHIPGSKKILYPLESIIRIEQENSTKEVQSQEKKYSRQPAKITTKKPVISARPEKEWRI